MGLERWPEVSHAVVSAGLLESVCLVHSPQRTISINNRQLTSGYDRTGEAVMQASVIPEDADEAWVYGHALGDTISQLLMRGLNGDKRTKIEKLHVVIMSRTITKAVLEFDPCGWTDSPRLEVHLARDLDRVHSPFIVSPVEIHQCDEDAEPLRDRLTVMLNMEFNEANLQARRHVELAQYEKNKANIERDPHVSSLFARGQLEAIVCGGGPTLAGCYAWMHTNSSIPLVAASTALAPLMRAGVIPDYVVVADPAPDMMRHFRGVDLDALKYTTLVYIPSAFPDIVSQWRGPRVCAAILVNDEGTDLFSGGSVVHAATDLAVKMGAREVYLCGMDFCYPGEVSHVDGASTPYAVAGDGQAWREKTKNGLGEVVSTDAALIQYRIVLNDYVTMHPHVAFYKLGQKGVPLKGVPWLDV